MSAASPPISRAVVRHCTPLDAVAAGVVERHHAAPCAVVACAYSHADRWHVDQGVWGRLSPEGPRAEPETIFDLASVTKPFTAVTLARLVRGGLLSLDMPTSVLLQEAQGTPTASAPLELLLAHRAGLEGHRPLYAPLERGASEIDRHRALSEAARARLPDCPGAHPPEGFPPTYSDLGYLLLGESMVRANAAALDQLIAREVCVPLGIEAGSSRQWSARSPSFREQVAPTEHVPWRGGLVHGEVHDENAWAMAGRGMCGHAGLFGRARDVVLFGAALLDVLAGRAPDWLHAHELQPLIRPRQGGTLRAGFDGKSETGSSAGPSCSSSSFGHLGFTGTSLWIDPDRSIAVALLSNRVYRSRANNAIKTARPEVHEALFQWAIEQRGALG